MGTLLDIYTKGLKLAQEKIAMRQQQEEFKANMENDRLRRQALIQEIKMRDTAESRNAERLAQDKEEWKRQEEDWQYKKETRATPEEVKAERQAIAEGRRITLRNLKQVAQNAKGTEFLKMIENTSRIIALTGNNQTAQEYLKRAGVPDAGVEEQEGGTYSITGSDEAGPFAIDLPASLVSQASGLDDPKKHKRYSDMMDDVGQISKELMQEINKSYTTTKGSLDARGREIPGGKVADPKKLTYLKSVWMPERIKALRVKYYDEPAALETILSQNTELKYADQEVSKELGIPTTMPQLTVDENGDFVGGAAQEDNTVDMDIFRQHIKLNDQFQAPEMAPVVTGTSISAPAAQRDYYDAPPSGSAPVAETAPAGSQMIDVKTKKGQ